MSELPGVGAYVVGMTEALEEVKPMTEQPNTEQDLMTPGEVARLFRVDPKTVNRWAHAGRLPHITTPGGHRRYPRKDVLAFIEQAKAGGQVV